MVLVPSEFSVLETRSPPAPTTSFFPPDPDFGEPLADHIEIAHVSCARYYLRHLIFEGDFELHVGTSSDRLWQPDLHDCVVFRVGVVGLREVHGAGDVSHSDDFDRSDANRSAMFRLPFVFRAIETLFGHPGGLGLEGV